MKSKTRWGMGWGMGLDAQLTKWANSQRKIERFFKKFGINVEVRHLSRKNKEPMIQVFIQSSIFSFSQSEFDKTDFLF